MKKQVAIIVGTRPEAIKMMPVYLAARASTKLEPLLVSTGQHREMLDQIFGIFGVAPDIDLAVMVEGQTLTGLTSRILDRLGGIFAVSKPDAVLVQGDTTTAFASGLVSFYHGVRVGHVEAGLRTYDNNSPFPEEVNRKLIGAFATWNFAPTISAMAALERENIGNNFLVGNTVIDALLICADGVKRKSAVYQTAFEGIINATDRIVLVTGHRRESFGEGFRNICSALKRLALLFPDRKFVYPVHLNPAVQGVVYESLAGLENVALLAPLPYDQMVYLMSRAEIILTDSGGIQEEGPTFGCPVVVMREKTEREEGIAAGCAVLAGTSEEGIVGAVKRILEDERVRERMSTIRNPYGDGTAGQQIVAHLEHCLTA